MQLDEREVIESRLLTHHSLEFFFFFVRDVWKNKQHLTGPTEGGCLREAEDDMHKIN